MKKENVLDEPYRKAGKMDPECFASRLDPSNTDLIKIVRGYLLEGLESKRDIKVELYKLNIYGKYFVFLHRYLPVVLSYIAVQARGRSLNLMSILHGAKRCLGRSCSSFLRPMRVELFSSGTTVANGSSTLPRRLLPSTNRR
jgi:hypothetical protein